MAKRNPVVRDLIQRPPRGAGKHRDRRKRPDRRDEDLGFVPRNIFDKTPTRGFFYETICSPHHFVAATKLKESEMNNTVRSKQVEFINEGRESHDWGFSDKKGRALGSRVAFCVKVFEEFVPEPGRPLWDQSYNFIEPGTYFCWLAQATRGGEDFGACQSWNFCKTEQERQAAVAKYIAGARKRAQRLAV